MKKFSLFFLCLLTINVFSQNWKPVLKDKIMNYKHSGYEVITNTIWITDTVYSFDTSLVLNRIVLQSRDDPNYFIKNSGQFLQKTIFILGDGVFKFTGPWSFVIKTKAKVGDTWIFNNDDDYTAIVDTIMYDETFNIPDSVKTIKIKKNGLFSGKIIKLSKNFGIIEFPDFIDSGNFVLAGIQTDTLGEQVVDFWDLYNFNVDDVFQYHHHSFDPGMGEERTVTEKYTITSKEVDSVSFHYVVEGIERGDVFDIFNPENSYTYVKTFVRNKNYVYSPSHFSNRYPNEFLIMPDCYSTVSANGKVYTTITLGINNQNLKTKRMGLTLNQNTGKLFYYENLGSDTLKRATIQPDNDAEGFLGIQVTESLGVTRYRYEWWEGFNKYYLEGYIKDGDTVGKITDDDVLLSTQINKKPSLKVFKIYPNPVDDFLFIERESPMPVRWKLQLYNTMGQKVMGYTGNEKKEELNCKFLSPGVYFYKISTPKDFFTGKFIKR